MNRRDFIGGIVGVLSSPLLMHASVFREPRSWTNVQQYFNRPLGSPYPVCLWSGLRSDGTLFYAGQKVIGDPGATSISVRQELDSFLDSRCECRIGYHCELHKHLGMTACTTPQ